MKFLTLFQSLRNILSHLKKRKPSRKSSDTPLDWKKSELVGICVGHSRFGDLGAVSFDKAVNEWSYNVSVAESMRKTLKHDGIESIVYKNYGSNSYSGAMGFLKGKLRDDKATLAVELHFNSYNTKVRGSETWYRQGYEHSKKLASFLQDSVIESYGSADRGIKPAYRYDNGYGFLNNPDIPAALCEPFFGDNKEDYLLFSTPEELGKTLANGIKNFLLNKHTSNQSARKDNAVE